MDWWWRVGGSGFGFGGVGELGGRVMARVPADFREGRKVPSQVKGARSWDLVPPPTWRSCREVRWEWRGGETLPGGNPVGLEGVWEGEGRGREEGPPGGNPARRVRMVWERRGGKKGLLGGGPEGWVVGEYDGPLWMDGRGEPTRMRLHRSG